MAGSRVERIPADQFNHTVTVLRRKDGTFLILDPTWVPHNRDLWSSLEALQGLVYGTPEGEDLTLSPYYEPEHNRRWVTSTGSIGADGTLKAKLAYDLGGAADNRFRRVIDGYPVGEQRAALEEALGIAPNIELVNYDHIGPVDYSRDGYVNMTVKADRYAAGGDDVKMFRMPLMSHPLNGFFRPRYMEPGDAEARQYTLRFWGTRMIRYTETLKLPPGWKVTKVPEAGVDRLAGGVTRIRGDAR